jgi:hypothetical protein
MVIVFKINTFFMLCNKWVYFQFYEYKKTNHEKLFISAKASRGSKIIPLIGVELKRN